MKINIILGLMSIFLLSSCTVKPKKINYGLDACNYCKMNIVDQTHAAQLVTKKGKATTYDAIECMIQDLASEDESNYEFLLVTDFEKPATLIDVTTATFLITEAIQSPMGANLSAFENKENAILKSESTNGKIFNWPEIKGIINK